MHLEIVKTESPEFRAWLREMPKTSATMLLLAGERITCCDEAVVCKVEGQIVSVATIAPEGEMLSGQPTIVALYTPPEFRRRGYGWRTFKRAVERCLERGFTGIRIEILDPRVRGVIAHLPEELRIHLEVYNFGYGFGMSKG